MMNKQTKVLTNLLIILLSLNVFYFVWSYINRYVYTPPSINEEGIPSITLLPLTNKLVKKSSLSRCYTFGPFSTKKAAWYISKRLNNFGLATAIKKQKTKQTLNFLVYLKSLPSRQEAEKIVEELKKQEIKNYRIISSGPYKNAIALGAFRNLDKARRHAEYIRFLGYDAKYTAQKKQKEVFWVDYDEQIRTHAPVMQWTKEINIKTNLLKIPRECEF